jgi:hypothetical protein
LPAAGGGTIPSWSGTECFDCLLRIWVDHCFGQRFEISGSGLISSTSLATALQKNKLNSAAAANQIGLRDKPPKYQTPITPA